MVNTIKQVLRLSFEPDRHTLVAFISGLLVIAVSAVSLLFEGTAWEPLSVAFFRGFLMVVVLGFALPLGYTLFVEKNPLSELGIKGKYWGWMLLINLVLAALLARLFISEVNSMPVFTFDKLKAIIYIMLAAGPFEVLFFYGFLQLRFERAFGIIPGILLAALFYSLHHVGFQPEYGKLFLVGVMYMIIFRTVRSILIIYPFFWGVGACWDVLEQFGMDPKDIYWTNIFWIVGLFLLIGWVFYRVKKMKA